MRTESGIGSTDRSLRAVFAVVIDDTARQNVFSFETHSGDALCGLST